MVETKVLVCGGLVAVAAYGIYACSCRLWSGRNEPGLLADEEAGVQNPGDLSKPLLAERDGKPVGRTWRRFKGILNSENERDLEEGQGWHEQDGEMGEHSTLAPADKTSHSSALQLEVIAGPSRGLRIGPHERERGVPLTVGRIADNDLVLDDPEVSGKHAVITWNSRAAKWELTDTGSLNGTLLNKRPVAAVPMANVSGRQRGPPVSLANGDIFTLGSSSQVLVQIVTGTKGYELSIATAPFGVGVAADAMMLRKGGKQLDMEDVCLCEWPLRGFQEAQFGVFCVFDGHGGASAAKAASSIMPKKLAEMLEVEETRVGVLSSSNAGNVLREAFQKTEEELFHEYEGCTATVLLLWADPSSGFYAQCANVGDSHCILSVGDRQVGMTEDHRLTSLSERRRLMEMGKQLKEGETRLCGMNIVRVLGDKFLKAQDGGFSSQPYISDVLRINSESKTLAIIASDGLWDVLSPTRALQLAAEAREGRSMEEGRKCPPLNAEGIANHLVSKARDLRTKDNTVVIVLDFGTNS